MVQFKITRLTRQKEVGRGVPSKTQDSFGNPRDTGTILYTLMRFRDSGTETITDDDYIEGTGEPSSPYVTLELVPSLENCCPRRNGRPRRSGDLSQGVR